MSMPLACIPIKFVRIVKCAVCMRLIKVISLAESISPAGMVGIIKAVRSMSNLYFLEREENLEYVRPPDSILRAKQIAMPLQPSISDYIWPTI